MHLINHQAPDFIAAAVLPDGRIDDSFALHEAVRGRYAVLFFYPLDFTFVCPTELIAFHHRMPEFERRDAAVIGVSIDSQYSHLAWRNTPLEEGGIGQLGYPLVADPSHRIVRAYGVQAATDDVALRATFLIDRDGRIRHQSVNDLPLGRNVDEYLRLIDALQFHERHGEVCPAGWQAGQAGLPADAQGVARYLRDHANRL